MKLIEHVVEAAGIKILGRADPQGFQKENSGTRGRS